jgi:hypothetical protein
MTHIDVAPPPAERDLANLDALTEGLRIVAAEAKAQGERDAATLTEVRTVLAEVRTVLADWLSGTDMTAAHALAKIAAAVNR